MKIITAVLVMAAGALSAQERVREFEPFNRFMERTRFASSMDLRSPRSKVRGAAAFNEMHRHLLKTYGVVEVKHSFVREGSHFDCVPVNQQPAVRELALESIAEAPPQALQPNAGAAEMSARAVEELPVDEFGNAMGCEASTIPMRRIGLEEMTRFGSLHEFLSKKPEVPAAADGTEIAPAVNAQAHKYAYMQQQVDNLGGNASLNIWTPYVDTARGEIFSLSQEWYVGGSGAATQTVEVGWQNYPGKYGSQSPVLFIYWTADNYSATGCYNLECGAFVQVSNAATIGASLGVSSVAAGAQYDVSARFYLYAGNWWLAINGNWIGYYPGTLFRGGQMTRFAQSIKFGTESVGTTTWPGEGSGYWSTAGWSDAAYQRNVFYADTTGTLQWANLTAVNPSPACYTASGPYWSTTSGWGVYFFAGGPGGAGCQ